jgi:hypothetical protein
VNAPLLFLGIFSTFVEALTLATEESGLSLAALSSFPFAFTAGNTVVIGTFSELCWLVLLPVFYESTPSTSQTDSSKDA